MSQKGFVAVVVIIVALFIGLGIAAYYLFNTPTKPTLISETQPPPEQQNPDHLFIPVEPMPDLEKTEREEVIRQKAVQVRISMFTDTSRDKIIFNFFEDVNYTVEKINLEKTSTGQVWSGKVIAINDVELTEGGKEVGELPIIIVVFSKEAFSISVPTLLGLNKFSYSSQSIKGAPNFLENEDYYLIYEVDGSKSNPD